MKSKLAQILRKWADLIAQPVKPTNEMTFRIDVDARGTEEMERVEQIVRQAISDNVVFDKCGNRRLRSL